MSPFFLFIPRGVFITVGGMGPYLKNIRSYIGSQCLLLPGVRAVIVNENDEILLQRRTDMDCWGLPAGSVELEETALEAIHREVLEETGLEVIAPEPMAFFSGPGQRFQYPCGDEVQCFSIGFVIRKWRGVPQADGVEGSEVRFWPLANLPADLVPIHARTIDAYTRYQGVLLFEE